MAACICRVCRHKTYESCAKCSCCSYNRCACMQKEVS
jgi:hypothetical protein